MSEKPRFAIIVGHEESKPGAHGVAPLACYEYEYNKDLAMQISSHLMDSGITAPIFFRDHVGIVGCYEEVKKFDPLGSVELHFNAANANARGTETLYVTPQSLPLASIIQACVCAVLDRTDKEDRHCQIVTNDDRGHINLSQLECASVISEPFFGDEQNDAKLGYERKPEIAKAVAFAIVTFLNSLKAMSMGTTH